jgi:hypothetical protein
MSILWKVGIPVALAAAYLAWPVPTEGERLQADIERLQAMRAELAADTRRAQLECMAEGADPQMAVVREACMAGLKAISEANASTAAALEARISAAEARLRGR